MKINVIGQINIQGVEMTAYQFPIPVAKEDNNGDGYAGERLRRKYDEEHGSCVYFGHLEILPFLVRQGYITTSNVDNIDEMFNKIPLEDIVEIPSSKCPDTRHCFIRVEGFGKMIGTPIFEQPNWREAYIHPISLDL